MALDFPSNPTNGQTYDDYFWDASTGAWRAQGAPITFPVGVTSGGTGATTLAQAQDNLGVGLVNIVPPTVNFSGGTAALNTLNEIAFTSVTSISLNDVFSSAYSNYRVILRVRQSSVDTSVHFRLRNAGVDNTTANYANAVPLVNNTGGFTYLVSAGVSNTYVFAAHTSLTISAAYSILDFNNPFATAITSFNQTVFFHNGSSFLGGAGGGFHQANYSATGITFYTGSGNMTGTVQVLGYNS